MPTAPRSPDVISGSLVTVAFLKAQLDEGSDHLGIFMPLLFDVLTSFGNSSFSTSDIHEAIATKHLVTMPQDTVATLLKRAASQKYLVREIGRYKRTSKQLPSSNVNAQKREIQQSHQRLAEALRSYAPLRKK